MEMISLILLLLSNASQFSTPAIPSDISVGIHHSLSSVSPWVSENKISRIFVPRQTEMLLEDIAEYVSEDRVTSQVDVTRSRPDGLVNFLRNRRNTLSVKSARCRGTGTKHGLTNWASKIVMVIVTRIPHEYDGGNELQECWRAPVIFELESNPWGNWTDIVAFVVVQLEWAKYDSQLLKGLVSNFGVDEWSFEFRQSALRYVSLLLSGSRGSSSGVCGSPCVIPKADRRDSQDKTENSRPRAGIMPPRVVITAIGIGIVSGILILIGLLYLGDRQ